MKGVGVGPVPVVLVATVTLVTCAALQAASSQPVDGPVGLRLGIPPATPDVPGHLAFEYRPTIALLGVGNPKPFVVLQVEIDRRLKLATHDGAGRVAKELRRARLRERLAYERTPTDVQRRRLQAAIVDVRLYETGISFPATVTRRAHGGTVVRMTLRRVLPNQRVTRVIRVRADGEARGQTVTTRFRLGTVQEGLYPSVKKRSTRIPAVVVTSTAG